MEDEKAILVKVPKEPKIAARKVLLDREISLAPGGQVLSALHGLSILPRSSSSGSP